MRAKILILFLLFSVVFYASIFEEGLEDLSLNTKNRREAEKSVLYINIQRKSERRVINYNVH